MKKVTAKRQGSIVDRVLDETAEELLKDLMEYKSSNKDDNIGGGKRVPDVSKKEVTSGVSAKSMMN
jgi:hypothetical protein